MEELLGVQVEETLPVGADNNIELSSYFEPEELQKLLADVAEEIMEPYLNPTEPEPQPSVVHPSEAQWQADEALEKEKGYNAAADLQAPSLQGHNHLFKSRPNFVDPFEAAWKAEEALENEKRYNDPANLHLEDTTTSSRLQVSIKSNVEILFKVYTRILTG